LNDTNKFLNIIIMKKIYLLLLFFGVFAAQSKTSLSYPDKGLLIQKLNQINDSITIKVNGNDDLPTTLIESYLNQGKDVRIESDGAISFTGTINTTTHLETNLTIVSLNAGLISFGNNAQILAKRGKLNINIETKGNIVFSELSTLESNGGAIRLRAVQGVSLNNRITINGQLNASSTTARGGIITLESDHINLRTNSSILSMGAEGGGAILIGGDWQGGSNVERRVFVNPNAIYQATTVTMEKGTLIDASASIIGKGGTVVLWSDINNSNSVTTVLGSIIAKGVGLNEKGGQIETSGHFLDQNCTIDAGNGGEWLIDPTNIIIQNSGASGTPYSTPYTSNVDSVIEASSIIASLNAGTSVSIQTGAGDPKGNITVNAPISKTSGASAILTLSAHNNVIINQPISSTASKLDIKLNSSGSETVLNSNLDSNGGDILFGTSPSNGNLTVSTSAVLNSGNGLILVYGAVYLGANLSLVSGTDISFQSTINGANALTATVGSTGKLIFNYAIGNTMPLSAITVTSTGNTYINGDVSCTGDQSYANKVFIGVDGVEQFVNGNFDVNLDNWSAGNVSVYLGTTPIGGKLSPLDLTYPIGQTVNNNTPAYVGTFPATGRSTIYDNGGFVTMNTGSGSCTGPDGNNGGGYCIVRGPYLMSDGTTTLGAGDSVSFRWRAVGGGDAFDAFGYLLNVNTGATFEILNQTGTNTGEATNWATATFTIPGGTSPADYKFIFVAGSFDYTGGKLVGATLSIDDVKTTSVAINLFVGIPDTNIKLTAAQVAISGNTSLSINTLEINNSDPSTITGVISGTGNLVKSGNTLVLTSNNTYTGTTTVSIGDLIFRNNAPNITTSSFVGPGNIVVEPVSASFTSAYTFNRSFSSSTKLGNLTIGNATNTSGIIISNTINIAGTITLTAGTVSQTAPIVANDLVLQVAGTITLNNILNNVVTISGGNLTSLGNLMFTDALGGLTVNSIISNGTIKIETLVGNMTLARNLSTTSTSVDAVILNAGKSTAIGIITGGDIIVAGSPTVTMGSGGITKFYTGSGTASTGLSSLVGSANNIRYNLDETATTFDPALSANNAYIFYREALIPNIISNFNNFGKMYHDNFFTIVAPTSNSSAAFVYTSSNPSVATISGTTVMIQGDGTTTITVSQAQSNTHTSGSLTLVITIDSVEVLTTNGSKSRSNKSYIYSNGEKTGNRGLTRFGEIKITKSN
jgi:autotransporter-associated beta strand protein